MTEREQPERPPIDPSSFDQEQLRQFQEFQRFKQFQEAHRKQTAGPPPVRNWRSFLRWLLRRRIVKRLITIALVIGAVLLVIDHYFGGSGNGSGGSNTHGGASPVLPQKPQDTVRGLYDSVANNSPGEACVFFTPDAAKAFARDMGATDCQQAVRLAASKVVDQSSYANPGGFPDAAVNGDMTISSCQLTVVGGDRLGRFTLHKQPNGGWIISGHDKEPACPAG